MNATDYKVSLLTERLRELEQKVEELEDYKVYVLTEKMRELEQKVEELVRTSDTAEAHIKFLEDELCTVVADGHYSRARGEA